MVKKSKITNGNTFNGNDIDIDGKHGSSRNETTLFQVFLQIYDHCFNT